MNTVILIQVAKDTYEDLDDSLFEAYVEEKSNPIVGAIEQNVYKGGFQWKTCKKPTGKQKNFENKNI